MEHSNTRLDPRIIRTRRLLRDAFVELLEEMDVEKISVNKLAERATINRVTFYLHYRDIPDMMEKMADDMIEEISAIMRVDESNSPEDRYEHLTLQLLEHIAQHHKFYKVILATNRTTVFTERLLGLLTRMVTANVERADRESDLSGAGIQKDVAIWYGSAALIGTIIAWLREDMPYTPAFLAKQFCLFRQYKRM